MGRNKPKKKNTYRCEVCNGTQDEPVVACDKCDKWHHFSCVGIKSIGKKETWFCNKCMPARNPSKSISSQQSISEDVTSKHEKLTSPSTKVQKENRKDNGNDYDLKYDQRHPHNRADSYAVLSPRDIYENRSFDYYQRNRQNENASKISNVSRATINRQEMELEMIKDERILAGIRDNEYLKKKYSILMQGKQHHERVSTASYESQSIASNTRTWVENQQSIKSAKIDLGTNKVQLEMPSSIAMKYRSQEKNKNQPKIQDNDNLLQCAVCHMVGDDEHFGACLLCSKHCHYACMDVIMIDDDSRYICSSCKNFNDQSSRLKSKKPIKSSTKQSDHTFPNMQCCGICLQTNNQEQFRTCEVCNNPYHYLCLTLLLRENEYIWICSNCKQNRIESTKESDSNQFHRLLSPVQENLTTPPLNQPIVTKLASPAVNTIIVNAKDDAPIQSATANISRPLPGASQTLTSAQIASRHVVTKDLPIFVGQPEQWPMFLSRFENSTKLCGFSDAENLDRLQKCLKGNALEAVRSRLLTAESVPDIISTLKMLYGRPELIVDSLMKKIRAKAPPKADQLNTMVDFALSVKNVCATLEQAKLHYHLSNPALVQELVDKLPTNFKVDWAKYKANVDNITLSTLGSFLFELAKVISTVTAPTFVKDGKDKEENKNKKNSGHKDWNNKDKDSSSGHVYAHQSQKQESNNMQSDSKGKMESTPCKICKKKCQKVENCPEFLSYNVDRRWKEIYKQRLCRKCLERHGRFCNQAKVCGVNGCIFKHHSLLHDVKKHSPEAIEQNQQVMASGNNNLL